MDFTEMLLAIVAITSVFGSTTYIAYVVLEAIRSRQRARLTSEFQQKLLDRVGSARELGSVPEQRGRRTDPRVAVACPGRRRSGPAHSSGAPGRPGAAGTGRWPLRLRRQPGPFHRRRRRRRDGRNSLDRDWRGLAHGGRRVIRDVETHGAPELPDRGHQACRRGIGVGAAGGSGVRRLLSEPRTRTLGVRVSGDRPRR